MRVGLLSLWCGASLLYECWIALVGVPWWLRHVSRKTTGLYCRSCRGPCEKCSKRSLYNNHEGIMLEVIVWQLWWDALGTSSRRILQGLLQGPDMTIFCHFVRAPCMKILLTFLSDRLVSTSSPQQWGVLPEYLCLEIAPFLVEPSVSDPVIFPLIPLDINILSTIISIISISIYIPRFTILSMWIPMNIG